MSLGPEHDPPASGTPLTLPRHNASNFYLVENRTTRISTMPVARSARTTSDALMSSENKRGFSVSDRCIEYSNQRCTAATD